MFKQLSQFSKNFTDELAKGLNDDLSEEQEHYDKNSDLPVEIQAKLRKFDKYEQKYPLLLNAYKVEKSKSEKLLILQKILSENTPVSSLDDFDSLTNFFHNTTLKTDMLNDEIKRLSGQNNHYLAELEELRAQIDAKNRSAGHMDKDGAAPNGNIHHEHSEEVLNEVRAKYERLEVDLEALQQDYSAKNEEHAKALATCEELQGKLEGLKGESDAELHEMKESLSKSEARLNEEQKAHQVVTGELEDLRKMYDERSIEFQRLLDMEQKGFITEDATQLEHSVGSPPEISTAVQGTASKSKKKKKKAKSKNCEKPTFQNNTERSTVWTNESRQLKEALERIREYESKFKVIQTQYSALLGEGTSSTDNAVDLDVIRIKIEQLHDENKDLLKQLRDNKQLLTFKSEELDNNKDILKSVGNELVTAKDKIKDLENGENADADHLKAQLEGLRENNSECIKNYELTLNELKQRISLLEEEKLKVVEECKKLRGSVASKQNDVESLSKNLLRIEEVAATLKKDNSSLSDQLRELSLLKRSESALKMSVGQKEKTIVYLEQQIKDYNAKDEQSTRALREAKREIGSLSSKVGQLAKEAEISANNTKDNKQSLEKFIADNATLTERLEVMSEKYETLKDAKSVSYEQVGTIRRQCDELNVKLKEANKRASYLEEELNEVASTLQERTKEVHGMRRLISESQSAERTQVGKLEQSLKSAYDEKERSENDLTLQLAVSKRNIQELREANERLKSKLQDYHSKEKGYESDITRLDSLRAEVQKTKSESTEVAHALEQALSNVKISLSQSEKKLRGLEVANEKLREQNNDLTVKLERISKNYKQVSNQLAASKERTTARGLSRSNSNLSIPDRASLENLSRRGSYTGEPVRETQTEINDKIAYIKNVLLGFLEHKDQRDMLLPVVSTLLQLDSSDEQRLLISIR
ncbi:LADA_0H11826g1_1 [Lachancea dasiensis]|uniref:LADA_0H11826g1_1 n=1 Tax=Lachancea dasiensis TaxID=1072105 RepID=A0A1G4K3L4_9SACH|nr:LADA_0H11826g1_1 [Lachancea dasiensis]